MTYKNQQMISFFKEVELYLKRKPTNLQENVELKELNLRSGECFFVFDLAKNEIVHFGGMKNLFGYDLKNIDLPFIFDKLHPDESIVVQAVIKNIVTQSIKILIPKYSNVLKMTSRFRKNNGEYIRVLSENFIMQTNNDGIAQSFLIRYTDVSFLEDSEVIDWWVNTNFINKEEFVQSIYGDDKDIFTDREKEIVLLVLLGITNKKISSNLNISQHTVATHRKNILAKSNCAGVQELKAFCKKNGVFEAE